MLSLKLRPKHDSLDWPKGMWTQLVDNGSHVTLVIWETNFKSLSGEDQVRAANMITELMQFSLAQAIPANLKVVRQSDYQ